MTKKKAVKKSAKTYVAILLDSSGSMGSIKQPTINHFNEQIQTLKKTAKGQDLRCSLVTFASKVSIDFYNERINSLKDLTDKDYQPDGMTALYDAIGQTIERLEKEKDIGKKDTAVLFVVLSDGEENNSTDYAGETGREKLQKKIKTLTDTGRWTFTYLGANQDITKVAKSLSIPLGNVQLFQANAQGMAQASLSVNAGLTSYMSLRSVGATAVKSFYNPDDKDKA